MEFETVAILSPGDMGHLVGKTLKAHGHRVVTVLAGRSTHTRALAKAGGFEDLPDLEHLVAEADLILSILPPVAATEQAGAVARTMIATGKTPPYADCNAIAPATTKAIGEIMAPTGANYIDAGIIGLGPGKTKSPTRFYVSGPDTAPLMALDGKGIWVKHLGPEIGQASGIKMCYASLTKGTSTLQVAVLLTAQMLGLSDQLREEFLYSQKALYERMSATLPGLPADAGRWIGEMEEIAKTYTQAGVTPLFHQGAAEIYRLLTQTPFAEETRETIDRSRSLEESVEVFAEYLPKAAE